MRLVLGCEKDRVFEFQSRLRISFQWLEIDDEGILYSEYRIVLEALVLSIKDLRGDGFVTFSLNLHVCQLMVDKKPPSGTYN
jgi:hypothetical protein